MDNEDDVKDEKRKNIGFRAVRSSREVREDMESEEETEHEEEEEVMVELDEKELAMITKQVQNVLSTYKNKGGRRNYKLYKKTMGSSTKNEPVWYEFGKSGHIKSECYHLKKKGASSSSSSKDKEPRRVYKAGWDVPSEID